MAVSLNGKYKAIERHRAVIDHAGGLLIVIAGPGTGKTYSLLRKIECLLEAKVDPKNIYYLTFVNSIVDAFKDDVRKPKEDGGLGVDPEVLGIHISTLHSLAFKIVKVYRDELQIPSHIEVIDLSTKPQDLLSQVFVGDLFEYSKYEGITANKNSFDQLLRRLTEIWRRNCQAEADCVQLDDAIALLCRKYAVCSWDQLVLLAIKAVTENGLPKWLQEAQHFLIDEYQDFNPAEQRLLDFITKQCDSIIIVGDPDQSIYSGRSASPQGLTSLIATEEAKSVNFVYCYRCPRKVVAAANRMLKFMDEAGFSEKEIHPFKDEDGEFAVTLFKSCKAEIEQIADILKSLDASDRAGVIILLPKKRVAEYYAAKICEAGVNCSIRTTDTSSELLTAVLRLVILHSQPFLERVILQRFSDLDRKYRAQVLPMFVNGHTSLIDTLGQGCMDKRWQKRLRNSLSALTGTTAKLVSDDAGSVVAGLTDLKLEASKEVVSCLLSSDPNLSARDRVEEALKMSDNEAKVVASDSVAVEVLTMHSSKGLSKRLVIIPAFDEKLLPGDNEGERFAEMHRLVYVAVTRAEGEVLITFPRTRAPRDPLNYGAKPRLSSYAEILTGQAIS